MEMVPADNFVRTLAANVDNPKLKDENFREFVRNTLPIVEYKRPELEPVKGNKPPVPTEPQTCKFCEYEWPGGEDHACEYSFDTETGVTSYCGNQECPMCNSCQGNTPTPALIRAAKEGRKIREESEVRTI